MTDPLNPSLGWKKRDKSRRQRKIRGPSVRFNYSISYSSGRPSKSTKGRKKMLPAYALELASIIHWRTGAYLITRSSWQSTNPPKEFIQGVTPSLRNRPHFLWYFFSLPDIQDRDDSSAGVVLFVRWHGQIANISYVVNFFAHLQI